MTDVNTSQHFPVPADQLWMMIGGFQALPDWHPMIAKSESKDGGKVRILTLPDGSTVSEKLIHHSDTDRSYTYAVEKANLPVTDCEATIRVVADDNGKGCTVHWSSSFQPVGEESAATAAIRNVYEAGIENLKKMFGQ